MTNKELVKLLGEVGACGAARKWLGTRNAKSAWDECPRGDWLLWIVAHAGVDRKQVVLAACACARLALPYVKKGETRPLQAIETAEAWAKGKATIEQVSAAASAASAASASDARISMQLKTADSVRAIITLRDVLAALKKGKRK